MFGNFNGCDFYLRGISYNMQRLRWEFFLVQLGIINALRKHMSFRFQMCEILKFNLRNKFYLNNKTKLYFSKFLDIYVHRLIFNCQLNAITIEYFKFRKQRKEFKITTSCRWNKTERNYGGWNIE